MPFEIPESWEWCHISDMCFFQEGPGILAQDFKPAGVPLIRIAGMQTNKVSLDGCNFLDPEKVEAKWNHFRLDIGDIVISTSASLDKIAEVNEEAAGAIPYTGLIRFKMYGGFSKEFFTYFIKSPCYINQIAKQEVGAAIKHYGPTHLKKMFIPIPPIEEQLRIVTLLDRIQPFLKEYSNSEKTLSLLNSGFPGRLKKSILQLAVQGKLVPQDPSDEPASILLERIREEKARLVKEGKIKKDKNESIIFRRDNSHYEKLNGNERCIDEELPFDIPDSWAWSRLKNLVYLTSGGQYPESQDGCLYVKVADMNLPENALEIVTSTRKTDVFDAGNIPIYSIIFPKRGGAISTNKKRVVMNEPICIDSNTMSMTVILPIIFDYLRLWFEGIDLGVLQSGTSVPQINNKDLEPLLIPVPPIEEQSRIIGSARDVLTWIEQM